MRRATHGDGRQFLSRESLFLLLIIAVGAALRLADLGLIRHSYDDSYPAYDALRMLAAGRPLLVGMPSSVFLDNPPLMSYIQALPLLVWPSPWGVYLLVVALNTGAIWLTHRAARPLLGSEAGLLAAALLALNPWVVFFSRKAWVQGLAPFFVTLTAWALWPALAARDVRHRELRFLLGIAAATAMTLTYIQTGVIWATIALLVMVLRRRISRRALLLSLAIVVVGFAPYAWGVAERWEPNRAKLQGFGDNEMIVGSTALEHAARLVTMRDFELAHAPGQDTAFAARRTASLALGYLLLAALGAGLVRAASALRRSGPERDLGVLLLAWFCVPVGLMTASPQVVHPHYLLITLPAGQALAAWGVSPLLHRGWPRYILIGAMASLALVGGINMWAANAHVARHPTGYLAGEVALGPGTQVGQVLRLLTEDAGRPPRIVAPGHEAIYSSLAGRYLVSLPDLAYPDYIVLPGSEPLVYLLSDIEPVDNALGYRAELYPDLELTLADGAALRFIRVLPYSRGQALALPQIALDWPSAAGLTLLGYTLGLQSPGDDALALATYWRVDALSAERWAWYVSAFYHLLDEAGGQRVNVSGRGQWAQEWREGDIYVERVRIPFPDDLESGTYTLRVGLFDPIQGETYGLRAPGGWVYGLETPVHIER